MIRTGFTRREWFSACGLLCAAAAAGGPARGRAGEALEGLRAWLGRPAAERPPLSDQAFARAPLTREESEAALNLLDADRVASIRRERRGEIESGVLKVGEKSMPIDVRTFGTPPGRGHSLWISLHGGGGAPPRVNDRQWENQKRLYTLDEGIYVAPRAPTDTWDLWHQSHIDALFARLIEDMVVFRGADPDRVYLLGYSAGGDGVYQVAPRMADRFAAAAMMAGHPNETRPLGLRNLPFALQVGADDSAYNRNAVARAWGEELAKLRADDRDGYHHFFKLHEGKGHWMGGDDKVALPWMARFRRDATPRRVVWLQDDVTHDAFYWLAVPAGEARAGALVSVRLDGQSVIVEESEGVETLVVRLDDRLVDLDRPVRVVWRGRTVHDGPVRRDVATLAATLAGRGDRALAFPAEVTVARPPG